MKNSFLVLVFLLAPSLCQKHSQRQEQLDDSGEHYHGQDGQYDHSNDGRGWDIRLSVPGEPEVDYPVLNVVPPTGFNCVGKDSGYYADIETRCQVFRVCTTTGPSGYYSFLCPNGTLFNQDLHVCDWWMNVNCSGDDSEILSTSKIQISPGSGMLQNIKNMIMYPMKHPIPSNYPKKHMTTQVYNPPVEMLAMFLTPPKNTEGQQLLGEIKSPNPNSNRLSTSIKQDSHSSGKTSFNNNPIVVNELLGNIANTPTVQEDLNSKFIQQQAEILNLQKQFNSNTQQQSIKITKQQYTYPSEFDKQYTVTVPKVPPQLNHPFVVNIPINIPALDANENLVSEQMVSDETNNRNPFQKRNKSLFHNHSAIKVASIPFVILLLKPNDQNHNHLTETRPEVIITNSSNKNFYNDHQNFIQRSDVREKAYTNSINYFYPHGFINPSAAYVQNPPNYYIPNTNDIGDDGEEDLQVIQPVGGDDETTVDEYNETTIDLDNSKDVQITDTEKDLIMEQLNKRLDKQDLKLTNDTITNTINKTNTNAENNDLVTIFSANVLPNGDESNEQVLKLCIPKEALIYLIRVHNATKRALERHTPNYQFPPHDNPYQDPNRIEQNMVNVLMANVLMKDLDYSDQQVPIVNDAELYRNQQFVSFQNQGTVFRDSNKKVVESTQGGTRSNQGNRYQNGAFVTGNTQSIQNGHQSDAKFQSNQQNTQNQATFFNSNTNQQTTVTTNNRFSAKFSKDQLANQISSGQQGLIQTNVLNTGAVTNANPQDEKYDQYRITSSADGPKTIVDEENRGEFYSLQHFGVRQQQLIPQKNKAQNTQEVGQNVNVQTQEVSNSQNKATKKNTHARLQQNQNQGAQQNEAQVSNGFAGLQKPMPFSRTPNSPPQHNKDNRILNHNVAGFVNSHQQSVVGTTSQQQFDISTNKNLNSNYNQQGSIYKASQEQTKTFGPKEFNQSQRNQFVQTSPGYYEQSQVSSSGQKNVGQTNNQNGNSPTNFVRKENDITKTQSNPTVSTQYYQYSNYQGAKNVVSNGGITQTYTQTTKTHSPAQLYQEQTNRQVQANNIPQDNGQSDTQGYFYNTNSQGTLEGTTSSQNEGTNIVQTNVVLQNNGQAIDQGYVYDKNTPGFEEGTNLSQNEGTNVVSQNNGQANGQGYFYNKNSPGFEDGSQNVGINGVSQSNGQSNEQGYFYNKNSPGFEDGSNLAPNGGTNFQTNIVSQNSGQVNGQGYVYTKNSPGFEEGTNLSQNGETNFQTNILLQNGGQTNGQGYFYNKNSQVTDKSIGGNTLSSNGGVNNIQTKYLPQNNDQSNTQGYVYQKSSQGYDKTTAGTQSGGTGQNVQTNNGNKYDQVLSIQKQLGGSNTPAPFMKTSNNQRQNTPQSPPVRLYETPNTNSGVKFSSRNSFNKNSVGQNQNSNQAQFSGGQLGTTQQIAEHKNQINRVGSEFVTTQNQQSGNGYRQSNGATNQNVAGQINRGANQNRNGQGFGGSVQFVTNGNQGQQNNGQRNQGGFNANRQVNTGIVSKGQQNRQPSTAPGGTQFVTSNAQTGQNVMTNVQVVPAYGFAIDNDRERNYFYSAMARGLKNVDRLYIPPYDDATADMMITEINRQSQLGQFTPTTFESMYNSFDSTPSFGVEAMINANYDPTFGNMGSNNQQILPMETIDDQIDVGSLGYPKEKPRIAFNF